MLQPEDERGAAKGSVVVAAGGGGGRTVHAEALGEELGVFHKQEEG